MSVPPTAPTEPFPSFVEAARGAPAEPYRSLKPFRFADAGILAARDREIERLVRLVTMYRGVLLYGESGTGKSSVVNAGVLPRLTEDGFWPHRVRVQPRPGQELVLEPIGSSDAHDHAFLPSAFEGAAPDGRLVLAVGEFAAAVTAATERGPILLVFDQFEELVTLFPEGSMLTDTQAEILGALVCLLRKRDVRVKMLFAFREDYLASLEPLVEEQPDLAHQSLRLVSPPLECAKAIIRAPFERFPGAFSRELSPELAERITTSLAEHSSCNDLNLSELQIVCDRLWKADDPAAVLYDRGIEGLLEDHLNEALDGFPDNLRVAASAVLSQMVTPRGTRNVISAHDLVEQARSHDDISPLLLETALERLERESGLIRRERRHDVDLYQITSEFLIPWISRRRDELREAQARRRERRRLIVLGSITCAVILVAAIVAVLAVTAIQQRRTAQQEKASATYVGLASTAQALLQIRPDVSLLLALEAYLHAPPRSSKTRAQSALMAAHEEIWRSGIIGILHGHADTVTSVAFDPKGHMLASASGDGTIRLWDTGTLKQVGKPLTGPPGGVFSVGFSPDGRTLASAHKDGTVRLWDVASQHKIAELPFPQSGIAISVAYSSDGRRLAAASLGGVIRLWNLASDRRTGTPTYLNDSTVRSIAFSRDSRMLAAVGADRTISLWAISAGTRRVKTVKVNAPLYSVAFSPVGHTLAAGGLDGNVWLWDLARATPTALPSRTPSPVYGVAFSHDGRTLASGRADDIVQLWDVAKKVPRGQPLTGHTGIVTSVAFGSDDRLASGSADTTIRLWPPHVPSRFGQTLVPHTNSVSAVAFTRDGHTLAWAHDDPRASIQLWDATRGRRIVEIPTPDGGVRSLAFSPDDRLLVSTSQGGTVQLWHVPSGQPDGKPIYQNRSTGIFGAAFSPNQRWLAFAGQKGVLKLWNLLTGRMRTLPRSSAGVFTVAFNHDGTLLASGGDDRAIQLWDVATGQPIRTLTGHTDAVFSVAFSHKGPVLASGGADDTVRLWNATTGRQIGQPLAGHHGYVRSVALSPDGRTLASGGADGTIRLWDVVSGVQLGEALGPTAFINSVAFSPDGRSLASGSRDGAIRLWTPISLPPNDSALKNEVCGFVGAGLSAAERSQYAPAFAYHDPCG